MRLAQASQTLGERNGEPLKSRVRLRLIDDINASGIDTWARRILIAQSLALASLLRTIACSAAPNCVGPNLKVTLSSLPVKAKGT